MSQNEKQTLKHEVAKESTEVKETTLAHVKKDEAVESVTLPHVAVSKEPVKVKQPAAPVSIKEQVKNAQKPNEGVRITKSTKVLQVNQLPVVSKDGVGYELPNGKLFLTVNGVFKKAVKA